MITLKLDGGAALLGLGAFRAAALAAAAFSSSFFACRKAAALLVRGAMLGGAATLLGRGRGFTVDEAMLLGRGASRAAGVSTNALVEVEGLTAGVLGVPSTCLTDGLCPATEEGRLVTAYREGVALAEACEGGLTGFGGLKEDVEVERDRAGVLLVLALDPRTAQKVGQMYYDNKQCRLTHERSGRGLVLLLLSQRGALIKPRSNGRCSR